MAEVSRNDAAGRNIHDSPAAIKTHESGEGSRLDLPKLPESASPAASPALNRSAEVVGRSMGNAVAGVRRLPQQFDKLRSRIHLVPRRQSGSRAAEDIREAAWEAAADWRDAAEETVSELTQRVKSYTHEVSGGAHGRWDYLRERAARRISSFQRDLRQQLATARRWGSQRPLYVIGGCAAAAFAAGVALRIWRSNCD